MYQAFGSKTVCFSNFNKYLPTNKFSKFYISNHSLKFIIDFIEEFSVIKTSFRNIHVKMIDL